MYPFYTNFASGSVASTKFNYKYGVNEWNLIPRKKGEKPIVLKIIKINVDLSTLTVACNADIFFEHAATLINNLLK